MATQLEFEDIERGQKVSRRWHMRGEGNRVFIMYGEEEYVRAQAAALGYTDVESSGYYSYATNSIIGPKDGPTFTEDNRKSGM
jgi:hypothetical protein